MDSESFTGANDCKLNIYPEHSWLGSQPIFFETKE